MKIRISDLESNMTLKVIDYDGLVEICNGNREVANDFLRFIRNHPDNQRISERWEVIEE